MTSPFDKLLELGFKGLEKPIERSPVQNTELKNPPKTGKPKTQPAKGRTKQAVAANPKKPAKSALSKKRPKPRKRAGGGAPTFRTRSPNVLLLTPTGTMKALPERPKKSAEESGRGSAKSPTPMKKGGRPRPAPLAPEKTVQAMIYGLPNRSMPDLQQQWINVLSLLEQKPAQGAAFKKFRDALIAEWGRRHRIAIKDPDHFNWPSAKAGPGSGSQPFDNWHSEGMLGYLGYRVGSANGATDFARRQILDAVFSSTLPPVNDITYVRDWGLPGTAPRLKRLANEIARFARNGKAKRSADMSSAVSDWEADLRYLHRAYYIGKFGFGWPDLGR